MSDKLGRILLWVVYLGIVRMTAKDAIPFILSILAVCLVMVLIYAVVNQGPPRQS